MKNLLMFIFVILGLNCSKSGTSDREDQSSFKQYVEKEANSSTRRDSDDDAKKYVAFACVVNNKPGEACESSKGKCSYKDCTELPTPQPRSSLGFSTAEMNEYVNAHVSKMIYDGNVSESDREEYKVNFTAIVKSQFKVIK